MYGWKDTFDRCEDNRSLLDTMLNPGAEVTCTRTFTILPLRFGAVGGTAAQRQLLPSLPKHLDKPKQASDLAESSYALRPMRAGFLYVLLKRKSIGSYAWHSQYRVSELGTLDYIDAENPWAPPAPISAGRDGIQGMTWMLKINDLDDIGDLRLLFSPAPLTKDVLRKYRVLALYRDTLTSRGISVKTVIVPGGGHSPSTARLDTLKTWLNQQGFLTPVAIRPGRAGLHTPARDLRPDETPDALGRFSDRPYGTVLKAIPEVQKP